MPKATPTTAELQADPYTRGAKVRLLDDIAGHPAGSRGKVALANGFTWQRYWVRFADGSSVGHISHENLVRAKDYDRFLVARDREAIEAEAAAAAAVEAADTPEPAGADTGDAAAAGAVEVNGVAIPQRLLDASAAARARLAG